MITTAFRRCAPRAGASALLLFLFSIPAAASGPAAAITLHEAVKAALAVHPRLAAFGPEREAADGRILQSSKIPNPELEIDVENAGGNYPGLTRSETSVTWSQPVEWGKKALRVRRAEAEKATALRDQQSVRLDVLSEVLRAYVGLQGAQKKLSLAREAESLSRKLKEIATERVREGAVSPIEETRASVAHSISVADLARAERDFESARRGLSAAIGEPNPSFASAADELPENLDVPDAEAMVARLAGNPDMARWETERAQRQAALEVEKSAARPDVTLRGGVKYLREEVETTFHFGFSIPLQLFDRNEGAIREAQARLSSVELERRDADNRLRGLLRARHAAMAGAAREAAALKGGSLAGAQAAYDAVDEGYRLGKFRYLDVLDAGKTLLELRMRYVDAIVELNLARVDVERLVAQLPGEGADRWTPGTEGSH